VTDYSAPGANRMSHVAHCLPIAGGSILSPSQYRILNEHCGVVADCDDTLEWRNWVHEQNVNRSGRQTQGSISVRHIV